MTITPLNLDEIAERRRTLHESMTDIALTYGVSREWVRRTLLAEYGTTWGDEIAEAQAAERESEMLAYRDELLNRVANGEVITTKDVIAGAPHTVTSAVEVLGDEWAWVAQYAQRGRGPVSDEHIYETVKRVWKSRKTTEPLSREQYDASRKPTDLSGARICQRMRWQDACVGAGVPVNETARRYDGLTEDNAVEWLTAFLSAMTEVTNTGSGYVGTVAQYELWAKDYTGAPSSSSIRIVLGSWNRGRAQATSRLCKWLQTNERPYPIPERTTAGHSTDDIRAWVEMLRADPGRSVASISRETGVPVATLRYHLRGL